MRLWIVLLLISLPVAATAKFGLPDIPVEVPTEVPIKIPGLDKILKEEPALTTSLADARTGVPFLDGFNPIGFSAMSYLPRRANGRFVLTRPGLYQHNFLSYCLHAGAYGPGSGDGYLWVPLKGARAAAIRHVLTNSVTDPEIPQTQVQSLVWGILARTRIDDMSAQLRQAARHLLTRDEIHQLNGGALGQIPPELLDQAFVELPPLAQRALRAEAEIRGMLAEGVADFDQLEAVAVVAGEPPPAEEGPIVPWGRWSYHPDGFFVRYFPSGYQRTRVQIYVPESFNVERDELGRITAVADQYGNRVETEYDEDIEPATVSGDLELAGYAFSSIRFVHRMTIPPEISVNWETRWEDVGWTFVMGAGGQDSELADGERFSGIDERYQWAEQHYQQLRALHEAVASMRKPDAPVPQTTVTEAMDLGNYAMALRAVLADDPDTEQWMTDHIDLVVKAWQAAVRDYVGTRTRQQAGTPVKLAYQDNGTGFTHWEGLLLANNSGGGSGGGADFGGGDAAQPGNPGKQRLGMGGDDPAHGKENNPDVQAVQREAKAAQAVRDAFSNVDPSGYDNDNDYLNDVNKEIERLARERGLSQGGGKAAHSPMGTRCSDGRLVPGGPRDDPNYAEDWRQWDARRGFDWAEEWVKPTYFAGQPDVNFKAALAHEGVHQATWERLRREGKSSEEICDWFADPKNRQQDELNAYKKQLDMLNKWLKDDC